MRAGEGAGRRRVATRMGPGRLGTTPGSVSTRQLLRRRRQDCGRRGRGPRQHLPSLPPATVPPRSPTPSAAARARSLAARPRRRETLHLPVSYFASPSYTTTPWLHLGARPGQPERSTATPRQSSCVILNLGPVILLEMISPLLALLRRRRYSRAATHHPQPRRHIEQIAIEPRVQQVNWRPRCARSACWNGPVGHACAPAAQITYRRISLAPSPEGKTRGRSPPRSVTNSARRSVARAYADLAGKRYIDRASLVSA